MVTTQITNFQSERRTLLMIANVLGTITAIGYIFYFASFNDRLGLIASVIALLGFCLSFLILYVRNYFLSAVYLMLVSLSVALLTSFIIRDRGPVGVYWFPLVPLLGFVLLGANAGKWLSLIFHVIVLFGIILAQAGILDVQLPLAIFMHLFGSMVVVSIISHSLTLLIERSLDVERSQQHELMKMNSELADKNEELGKINSQLIGREMKLVELEQKLRAVAPKMG